MSNKPKLAWSLALLSFSLPIFAADQGDENGDQAAAPAASPAPSQHAPSLSPPAPRPKLLPREPGAKQEEVIPEPQPMTFRTQKDPKSGKEVIVITNDDIERFFGGDVGSAIAVTTGLPTPSPAAAGLQLPVDSGVGGSESASAPVSMSGLKGPEVEAELRRLQRNAARLRNPLLGRPSLTAAEQEKLRGKGSREALQQTNDRIANLESELAKINAGADEGDAGGPSAEPSEDSDQQ